MLLELLAGATTTSRRFNNITVSMGKEIVFRWSGKEYPVELADTDTVEQLKRVLQEKTQVSLKQLPSYSDEET